MQRSAYPLGQWILEPYGAPTRSSEVNRISGFYSVEALRLWAPGLSRHPRRGRGRRAPAKATA